MTQRLISFNLLWKYNFIINNLFFDFSFRYSLISNSFSNMGPLSSSFFLSFLADSSNLNKVAGRAPWLFLELTHLSPVFLSGLFKWVSRKKTLLLNMVVSSHLASTSISNFVISLFSLKSPIGLLLNKSSFFFFNKVFIFRLLVVDVTKLKRISGDIFYNWFFKFQVEFSFSIPLFFHICDFLSLYITLGTLLQSSSVGNIILADA